MSTEFFCKRIYMYLACALTFFVLAGVYAYARFLDQATTYALSKNYYFLASDSTHVEASAYEIVGYGGAGYLYSVDDRDYVVISVYDTAGAAERIGGEIEEKTLVLQASVDNLYFKTPEQKRSSRRIINAFSCLDDCIEVLGNIISLLENGETQEACKRLTKTLAAQFSYLSVEYEESFPAYAVACGGAFNSLDALQGGVLYVSDLRYVQCSLCDEYVRLSLDFSL